MNVATHPLRVLSLCSGYGGLDLAVKRVFPSARTLCYVEREVSAVRVLASRMAEGSLDSAPVWDDVSTFDPAPWVVCVDLVVAGFPCQPHSIAGKREGTADHRWPVWDDIIRIAKSCAARSVFLENVPGLLTSSGGASIAKVRADLDRAGFTHQSACIVAASDVGASHRRNRLFILAYTDGTRQPQRSGHESDVRRWAGDEGEAMAHAKCTGLEGWQAECRIHQRQAIERGCYGIFAPGPDADWSTIDPKFWPATAQSSVRGMADGTSRRLDVSRADRLRLLGNGVVPLQAAIALKWLMNNNACPQMAEALVRANIGGI